MAWNKPNTENQQKKPNAKTPSLKRGIIAGAAIVIALGALCLIFFGKETRQNAASTRGRGLIKEVKPAIAPKTVETNAVKKIDPKARPTKIGEVVNGYIKLPSGRIHRQLDVVTNSIADRPQAPYHIFTHSSENEIACYLWLKPGDMLVGDLVYDGTFTKDFLESLKEPIIVTKDDTPEQADLKRQVNAAKVELKAAYDRGEDIEKIMQDARKELQNMMFYKNQIRDLYDEAKLKDCKTDKDVEDLVDACNKMLEAKGIAPLKLGPFGRRKLRKVITK